MPDCFRITMRLTALAVYRNLTATLVALLFAGTARAGGFYLPVQSAVGVGLATAGGAALAADASTLFFNPAGMTRLSGATVEGGVDVLFPRARIRNEGSSATMPGTFGGALGYAGENGNAEKLTPVPNLYYVRPLRGGDLWIGLAITAPFGLGVDYGRNWFGRYDSIKSELLTADIAPSVAYRLNPSWSIGGGLDVQYAKARLTNALPNTLNPGGPTPASDGLAELRGDSWALGFNVGTLFNIGTSTRVGVHYRSRITHRLDGDATVSGLTGPLAAANGKFNTSADLKLPPIASVAVAHELSRAWGLVAEVQWFGWSVFDEIRIKFANGLPDQVRPQEFRDSWSFAAGAEYKLSDYWKIRAGARFETTPTIDAFRNTSIPDSDLIWVGFGVSYMASDRVLLDIGFLHGRFEHAGINLSTTFFGGTPAAGTVSMSGRTDNDVNTIALSGRYRF
jgi:long-chain fatty acid transport protein